MFNTNEKVFFKVLMKKKIASYFEGTTWFSPDWAYSGLCCV